MCERGSEIAISALGTDISMCGMRMAVSGVAISLSDMAFRTDVSVPGIDG